MTSDAVGCRSRYLFIDRRGESGDDQNATSVHASRIGAPSPDEPESQKDVSCLTALLWSDEIDLDVRRSDDVSLDPVHLECQRYPVPSSRRHLA